MYPARAGITEQKGKDRNLNNRGLVKSKERRKEYQRFAGVTAICFKEGQAKRLKRKVVRF